METKNCPNCGPLPLVEFGINRSTKDGKQRYCFRCQRAKCKKHYDEKPEYYIQKAKARNAEIRAKLKAIVDAVKQTPCACCGNCYPPYVMDLHHREGEQKIGEISHMVRQGVKEAILRDEIAKCEVLCANCHREHTYAPVV